MAQDSLSCAAQSIRFSTSTCLFRINVLLDLLASAAFRMLTFGSGAKELLVIHGHIVSRTIILTSLDSLFLSWEDVNLLAGYSLLTA